MLLIFEKKIVKNRKRGDELKRPRKEGGMIQWKGSIVTMYTLPLLLFI